MTIAVDIRTGAVVGQVTQREPAPDVAYPNHEWVTVVGRGGQITTYLYPSLSVRLKTVDSD